MKNLCTHYTKDALDILEIDSKELGVVRAQITARMPVPAATSRLSVQFFAAMLERGSVGFSKDAYEEKLETLGAQVDIDGDGEYLHIGITTRTEALGTVLAILKDTLTRPRFLEEEMGKLKKEFTQAFHEEGDNTRALAYGLFSRILYTSAESEYVPNLETRRTELRSLTKKSLEKVHRLFLESPWVVSVAGSTQARADVLRVATLVHAETTPKTSPSETVAHATAQTQFFPVAGKQNIEFFIGNRLPLTLTDADYLAFSFGLDVLGKRGGFAGRLMETVREKEGLTYSIYASLRGASTQKRGHWHIWTFFTPKDTPQGISSTMREIRTLVEKGVTNSDVVKFKELLTNQFYLAHESTSSVLSLYHSSLVLGRTPDEVRTYTDRLTRLTRAQINSALVTHLHPDALVIAGAGPTSLIPAHAG